MAAAKTERHVLEFVQAVSSQRVDRANHVLRGVKVLGLISKNGHEYTRAAIGRARKLYEGAPVFLNHPAGGRADDERKLADQFGWLERVREAPDGLYADLPYYKSHPMAGLVAEIAERSPDKMGLSHNAAVQESIRGGKVVLEAIVRVRSVDLVCRPATTRGVFESVGSVASGRQTALDKRRVMERVANRIVEEAARSAGRVAANVLESVGVVPTAVRVRAMLGVPEAKRRELAESFRAGLAGRRGGGGGSDESGADRKKEFADADAMLFR